MQHWQEKNEAIKAAYLNAKQEHPEKFESWLTLSWSNWGFGIEPLQDSVARLARHGLSYIELHANGYGPDLGYKPAEVQGILNDHGIKVSGLCGIFSPQNELASNDPFVRQNAIDYIRRNAALGGALNATYLIIVPGAVGRTAPLDDQELHRSIETLRIAADSLADATMRGAVEPIRSAETCTLNTFAQADAYIQELDHPAVQHINGDIYHMLAEEDHIAETLVEYGPRLCNLHLADTNRQALGCGMMDLDTIIMALYLIGYNRPGCFCTPEPLGPGGNPYPAMFGKTEPALLDQLVEKTILTWHEREEAVRALT